MTSFSEGGMFRRWGWAEGGDGQKKVGRDALGHSKMILKHEHLKGEIKYISVLQQHIWLMFSAFLEKVESIEYNIAKKHMLNIGVKNRAFMGFMVFL